MGTPWPVYEADKIAVLTPDAPVALVVLWRRLDTVIPRLEPAQERALCAVGNLYSKDGINLLVRNVLAKPTIRRILVAGPDLSGSGAALLALIRDGVGEDRSVRGVEGARIDAEIPDDALALLRENVEAVDLRGGLDITRLEEFALPPGVPWAAPAVYPERVLEAPSAFPSEATGIVLRGKRVVDVWLEALFHVQRFGVVKGSEYQTQQRELVDLLCVVEDEDPLHPDLQPPLPVTAEELPAYYERMLTAAPVPDVAYTYGQRLRDFRGFDQYAYLVRKLTEQPTSRRAIAVTWDHERDPPDPNPPCLVTVQATIQSGALLLTATIRSNDMYGGWPRNALALRELQRQLATDLGVRVGPLTTLSQSAHVYATDWPAAAQALETGRGQRLALTDFDPRGNLLITVDAERREIVCRHQAPDGIPLGEYRAASAAELLRALDHDRAISLPSHAAYIGLELGRAEQCLLRGRPYAQDRAPSL